MSFFFTFLRIADFLNLAPFERSDVCVMFYLFYFHFDMKRYIFLRIADFSNLAPFERSQVCAMSYFFTLSLIRNVTF